MTGALALLVDGRIEDVADIPAAAGAGTKSNRIQAMGLREILQDWGYRFQEPEFAWVAVVEAVNVMPKNGAIAAFSVGHSLGTIEAVLACEGIGVERAQPAAWKRAMGLGTDKAASRALATQHYPADAHRWRLAKHHNRAEAVLIAHWWITRR